MIAMDNPGQFAAAVTPQLRAWGKTLAVAYEAFCEQSEKADRSPTFDADLENSVAVWATVLREAQQRLGITLRSDADLARYMQNPRALFATARAA